MSASACCPFCSFRQTRTTRAPVLASPSAVSFPMPLFAPVTSAITSALAARCSLLAAPDPARGSQLPREHPENALERDLSLSSLIRDDDAALEHNLRLQEVPVAVERVAGEQHDVGELARFERP